MRGSPWTVVPSVVLAAAVAVASPAAATERILSFHADIEVTSDTALNIRETIRVLAEGHVIRHGIYRDFPTRHDFHPQEAFVDGHADDFGVQAVGARKRVVLGQDDVLLPAGEHVFTLSYRTDAQLGFFADHDQLYWNVTGNDWPFPMDAVSAEVHVPAAVAGRLTRIAAWSGHKGSTETSNTAVRTAGGVRFECTRPLAIGEGFTILLAWPKGLVFPPSRRATLSRYIDDEPEIPAALMGIVLLLAYGGLAWLLVGRPPPAGRASPSLTPPEGLSPAQIRMVWNMGMDDRTFGVALVSMATKGYLRIARSEEGVYSVERIAGRTVALAPEEQALAEKLFDCGDHVLLRKDRQFLLRGAQVALSRALKRGLSATTFKTNRRWIAGGLVLATIIVLTTSASAAGFSDGGPLAFCLLAGFLGVAALFVRMSQKAWRARRITASASGEWLPCAVSFAIGAGLAAGMIYISSWIATGIVLLTIAASGALTRIARVPTRAGRAIMDRIAGFKIALESPDAAQASAATHPYRGTAAFESHLPYALALDVEASWTAKFSDLLARTEYRADWCDDHLRSWLSIGDSAAPDRFAELCQTFTSTVTAATNAADSSGGDGGGGSSGGGGGGGGGGGW